MPDQSKKIKKKKKSHHEKKNKKEEGSSDNDNLRRDSSSADNNSYKRNKKTGSNVPGGAKKMKNKKQIHTKQKDRNKPPTKDDESESSRNDNDKHEKDKEHDKHHKRPEDKRLKGQPPSENEIQKKHKRKKKKNEEPSEQIPDSKQPPGQKIDKKHKNKSPKKNKEHGSGNSDKDEKKSDLASPHGKSPEPSESLKKVKKKPNHPHEQKPLKISKQMPPGPNITKNLIPQKGYVGQTVLNFPQQHSREEINEELAEKEKESMESEVPTKTGDVFIQENKVLTVGTQKVQFMESSDIDFGHVKVFGEFDKGKTTTASVIFEVMPAIVPRIGVIATIMASMAGANKTEDSFLRIKALGTAESEPRFRFLLTDEIGVTLNDLRVSSGSAFSFNTARLLTYQTMHALEQLHEIKYVCRDVKPSAFCVCTKRQNKIFLVHLGFAKRFADNNGVLKKERPKVAFFGNIRYASRRAHEQRDRSRGDDFESWYYMVCEFFGQRALPWRTIHKLDEVAKHKLAFLSTEGFKVLKQKIPHIPQHFEGIMSKIAKMKFDDEPDYKHFRTVLYKDVDKFRGERFDWDNFTICKSVDINKKPSTPTQSQNPPPPSDAGNEKQKEVNVEPVIINHQSHQKGKSPNQRNSTKEVKPKDSSKEKASNKDKIASSKEKGGSNKEPQMDNNELDPVSVSKKDEFMSAKDQPN